MKRRLLARPFVHVCALAFAATALTSLTALQARAQSENPASGLVTDATVLPSRAWRIGAFTSFTRWDELLGDGGGHNIAGTLANNAVGTTQFPYLTQTEKDIQSASSISGFHLNVGQLSAAGNSRIFTMPLVLEYGLSSHLTLGVSVPLVETRTTLVAALNPKLGFATVGANPALSGNAAAVHSQNLGLITAMRNAADTLQRRITFCQATPTDPICTSLNGQIGQAQTLIQNTTSFANALETLYGTDATNHPGDPFVPIASDPAAIAIANRILSLNSQYQSFVNRSLFSGALGNAQAPIARDQLQALLAQFGHDSIQVDDRDGIGDISIGATYQIANSFGDTSATAGFRYRLALNGTFRIGTGQPANRNRFLDLGTGYGQHGVAVSAATDLAFSRRFSATAIGSFTKQLGTIDVNRVPNAGNAILPFADQVAGSYSAGDEVRLSVMPHVQLHGFFAINGLYSLVHIAADTYTLFPLPPNPTSPSPGVMPSSPYGAASATAQQLGLGFSYSTVGSAERGPGRIPFEVLFNHLETIAGSGGPVAKTFQEQIELRVFVLR